jgi:TPR repeat protein
MRTQLTPVTPLRRLIHALARKGLLDGQIAADCALRERQQAEVAAMRRRADAGDVRAMVALGRGHSIGWFGLPRDRVLSFHWFRMAADRNDVAALAVVAACRLNGVGTARTLSQGMLDLGRAVELGSEYACHILGFALLDGLYGLTRDEARAQRFLDRARACELTDSTEQLRMRMRSTATSELQHTR